MATAVADSKSSALKAPAAETKASGADDKDPAANEKLKIKAAWAIFDKEKKGFLPKEDVLCIMQYLSSYPTDEEFGHDVLPQIQDDEDMQFVKYERFEPYMVKVQQERLFEPDSEETLLQAFKMFDPDQKKYIDENSMIEILTDNPYAFRDKELEAFLDFAKDQQSGNIFYEDYIQNLQNS